MKNPMPVNLTSQDDIRAGGWIAEARDEDGHLVSTRGWIDGHVNASLIGLGEFVAEYEDDFTVTVFGDLLAGRLSN